MGVIFFLILVLMFVYMKSGMPTINNILQSIWRAKITEDLNKEANKINKDKTENEKIIVKKKKRQ